MENKKYRLYFENSAGKRRKISEFTCTEADALSNANGQIHTFCEERNFRIYYTRRWNTPEASIFDVGSHTEFFHLEPPVPIN